MSEPKKTHNANCKLPAHEEHLCYLIYDGYHYRNPAEYKALVHEAGFMCRQCGRTAEKAANLCDPREL